MTFKKYIIIIVTTFLFSNSLFAETITEQLTTLNNLYKEGAITEEEFSKAKKLLLEVDTNEKTKKVEEESKIDLDLGLLFDSNNASGIGGLSLRLKF